MSPQEQLLAKIKSVETLVESYREAIEPYLTDTTYPLEERWLVYEKLPSFLRNHLPSTVDFLFTTEGKVVELYEVYEFNRCEVINVVEFFESWDDSIKYYNVFHTEAQINIDYSKGKILEMNLGSFINDW